MMQLRKLAARLNVFVLLLALCFTGSVAHAHDGAATGLVQQAVDAEQPVGAAATNATELLIYDLNRLVTIKDKGFPRDQPPRSGANGNWVTPVNYAEGTLYFRVEIRSQPQPQRMQTQFCIWQDDLVLENCGPRVSLTGHANTVVTWSKEVKKMYKKNGVSLDWSRPRQRYGIAIKNSQGLPVSSIKGWNWSGENPAHWYPMNMRFSVVVVAKGATFSGWQNYVNGSGATVSAAGATEAALISGDDAGSGLTWEAALEQEGALQAEQLENVYFLPLVTAE